MLKIGSNDYYEAYAKISLIDIYNKKLISSKVIGVESPDIQDDINDIGIEVTRSSTNEECITDSISNTFFNKGYTLDELKSNIDKKFKSFKGTVGRIDNYNYISSSVGLVDTNIIFDKIKTQIIIKSEKFNNHYKKFKENDLYIFCGDSILNICDVQMIMNDLKNIEFPFDNIFINGIDKIFICNKNTIITKNINYNKLKYYKSAALNYTE